MSPKWLHQMKVRNQIPSSYDQDYFADGDVRRIEKSQMRNVVCRECSFRLDGKKREVNCEICGRGFSFLPHQVVEYVDKVVIPTLAGEITIPIK